MTKKSKCILCEATSDEVKVLIKSSRRVTVGSEDQQVCVCDECSDTLHDAVLV